MRSFLISSFAALAIVASVPTNASAHAPRLLDDRLVLAGVEAPQTVAETEALSDWRNKHWWGAMLFAGAGNLAGWLIGGGAAFISWELGLQDPMGMFSAFLGIAVGSVAAALLSAVGADLFADLIGTPASFGSAFVGAAIGVALGLVSAPIVVGFFLFPAIGAAMGAYASIDWSAVRAQRIGAPPEAALRDRPSRAEPLAAATVFPVIRGSF